MHINSIKTVYSIEDLALTHLMQNFHDGFNAEREGINQWQINNIEPLR